MTLFPCAMQYILCFIHTFIFQIIAPKICQCQKRGKRESILGEAKKKNWSIVGVFIWVCLGGHHDRLQAVFLIFLLNTEILFFFPPFQTNLNVFVLGNIESCVCFSPGAKRLEKLLLPIHLHFYIIHSGRQRQNTVLIFNSEGRADMGT